MSDSVADDAPTPPHTEMANKRGGIAATAHKIGRAGLNRAGQAGRSVAQRLALGRPLALSKLTTRIFLLTMLALCIQVGGVLYVSEYRADLIKLRLDSLKTEAEILALNIAESAGNPYDRTYDRAQSNEVLRRLAVQIGLRAKIFDGGGRLTGDSRALIGNSVWVEEYDSPLQDANSGALAKVSKLIDYAISGFTPRLPLYRETPPAGISRDPEVWDALVDKPGSSERVNSKGELILSVAVPIKHVRTVMGAVVVSTEGGDIDELTERGLDAILHGFAVAALVTMMLSIAIAHTIARPIRHLSEAAEEGLKREKAPLDPGRIDIPDMSRRADEIGHLSIVLRRMTSALYDRIDAIENFASDVAHEIKNPLTSMRSAVESFRGAKNDMQRAKLLEVIENDVRRLDRLVTEISNASRLDAELVREQRERFNLNQLLANVIAICESICEGQNINISLDSKYKKAMLNGLEDRLAQVFHNLLDNAASFSPEGGEVVLRLTQTTLEGDAAWLVEISDEGPGIPPDNLESVFKRFYSERPDAHEFGKHSGLGLAICRQIVEAHGGRVWCDNRSDRSGALFSVVLPQ